MTDFETRLKPLESVLVGVYTALFVIGCIVLAVLVRKHLPRLRANWGENVRDLSARLWTWNDFACVLLPAIALSAGLGWYLHGRPAEGSFLHIAASLFLTHAPILLIALTIPLIRGVHLREAFGGGSDRFLRDLLTGAALYTAMIAFVLPALVGTEFILKTFGHEPSPQEIVKLFSRLDGFAQMLIASWTVLIAPIAEELLFRGVLLPLLLRHLKTLPAVALLSLGFALLHFDATAMLPLFIVSICLSLAFIATRSLVVTIAMHALFNSLTTLVLLLTG